MATSTPLPEVMASRVAVGAIDHRRRPEFFGDLETFVIEINDDDVRRGVELRRQQRRQADGAGADDGHGIPRFDRAVEDTALIAGRQDVAQHHH